MSKSELLKRYLFFLVGLLFSSLGISLITKSGLGTSPISSVPYVLSLALPLSLGQFTLVANMAMLAGQILILKKDFQKVQLMQIPITILFGLFIDFFILVCSFIKPVNYIERIFALLFGCVVLGLGICMEILADVVILSGEGLVKAIAFKLNKEFGFIKTLFDSSLVVIAILISLSAFGRIEGLREGTILSALAVGSISRWFIHKLGFLNDLFAPKIQPESQAE